MQIGKILHGGDYNPEQWLEHPDVLAADLDMMEEAGVNAVTLGVFSWSALESAEGVFELDWLEQIIGDLYERGISTILATPSAARPAWLAFKYPEVSRVRADRERELYCRRQNYCLTSPVYREKVRIIDERLARRFAGNPAIILWHISNEMGGECHCPLCQEAFRQWLRKRYGSLNALNRAWNARFWSHDYTDWQQIESPSPRGENAIQGLALDWKRFTSRQHIEFFKFERDVVKAIVPDAKFTANMMYRFNDIDYFDLARELDVASWDNYPTWHKPSKTMEEVALDTAMMHDLFYSLKGRPFLMMESSPSFTNWQPVSKQKKPGVAMLAALQAVAHGSDSVLYFQWRASRGAEEKFHGAVVGHDGREDARPFVEACEVGEALQRLSALAGAKREKQAVIVHDWQNKWALEGSAGIRNAGMGYWEEIALHYNALARLGIDVSFADMSASLSGYSIVVAPMLYLLSDEFARRLCDFAEAGGTVVVTYWSGVVNESDLCYLGDTPHGLTELLGLRRGEIDAMYDEERVRCIPAKGAPFALPEAQASMFCEVPALLEDDPAEPLLVYGEDYFKDRPAAAVHKWGRGRAYYIASRFDEGFYAALYRRAAMEAKLKPAWPTELPRGVLATRRGEFVFLQNFNAEPAQIGEHAIPGYGTEVLSAEKVNSVTRRL